MWSATKKNKVGPSIFFPPSETCFMVGSCDRISKSLSWFTTRSLTCEIIQEACQNTSLLLLWGHYGLKPKVQPFYTEALIYVLPVQVLLHLFWHDRKLLSQATDTFSRIKALHIHVNTVGGAQGLRARTDFQVLQHSVYLMLKFSVQQGSNFPTSTLGHEDCFSEK